MSEIVHITFEKLTGLKGSMEGWFLCNGYPDAKLPLVHVLVECQNEEHFVFRQQDQYFLMTLLETPGNNDFKEHFKYGMNFLIKEWSYGGGVRINSQNPN